MFKRRKEIDMSNRIKLIIVFIILLVFLTCMYLFRPKIDDNNYNFKIYFFNAGKADCILISNNGKYIMIDTGEESLSSEILAYFNTNNITKLDYLIITHFDKDHVGSASRIINSIEIDNILQSNCPKESEYYTNYLNALTEKNITPITISGDETFTLEELNIVVNGPTDIYDSNESNNSSLIVEINYKNTNYLFMGDSQNDRIKDYLEQSDKEFDFIKIPYHGNYQKRLSDLIEATNPHYAVVTCSSTEPDISETMELLKGMNINYYLTKDGSITVQSDGDNIYIKQ